MELNFQQSRASAIEMQISSIMPEKATPVVVQNYVDMVLLNGLKHMSRIIETSDKDSSRVSAFNGVINLGKFMEERIQNSSDKKDPMEIDI